LQDETESQLGRESALRHQHESEIAKLQQQCDDLNLSLAKVQRDAVAVNERMQAAEQTFRSKYEKLQAAESRLGRLEGLLSSMRELVDLKQQASVGRIQNELDLRKRSEQEARDTLESTQQELTTLRSEMSRLQSALASAEENVRVAVAAQRSAEENGTKEVARWRAKAAKYRSRKMQAEELLRMEVQTRASGGIQTSTFSDKQSQAKLTQMEMDKLRAEEALRAEREQWQLQEHELRASLDSLRMHSLQNDMARFRREEPTLLSKSPQTSELQMLSRKAVLLEHAAVPPLARSSSSTRSTSRRKR